MNNYNTIEKCIGCGLCKSVFRKEIDFRIDSKGFMRPIIKNKIDKKIFDSICPLMINPGAYSNSIWGYYENVYLGASTNDKIKQKASSGGVISQLLVYLLENKRIDAVIHIGPSHDNPLENNTYISTTIEQVLSNSGSRYSPAAPLEEIDFIMENDKKYAFVGKPCDVRALKNYASINKKVYEKISYMFSFFCAGTPSYLATDRLVETLGVNKNEIKEFQYRGNGWPGFATATTYKNEYFRMTYDDSWGKILGRDIQPYCRWCADGVGEFADVSCGDAWYLDENNNPIFSEGEGRNVIFARNSRGDELINELVDSEQLAVEPFNDKVHSLKYIQKYQFERKATMLGKVLALRMMKKNPPKYQTRDLIKWSSEISLKVNVVIFLGTIRRILKGKL